MKLDPRVIADLTVAFRPVDYVRVLASRHALTPLGMGYGETRFSSPARAFQLLYIARDLATGIAETIIRDRF